MQTWGYIKQATLAKLDLEPGEAEVQNLLGRFYIFANEAMSQICSSIKPKYTYANFVVTKDMVGKEQNMPNDFISFGDDINIETVEKQIYSFDGIMTINEEREADDNDFEYCGTNKIRFFKPGNFRISYNANWFTFTSNLPEQTIVNAPDDVLNCLPSYIAHQCFKIDDEVKSSIYRNEYEMFLARIDNTHYKSPKHIVIGGGW